MYPFEEFPVRSRIKKLKHDQLDLYLFKWLQTKRKRNLIVSGKRLQSEAIRMATKLGLENSKASNGWLGRFKLRHRIKSEILSRRKWFSQCSNSR